MNSKAITIMGINAAYCQSSAALIQNNQLIAAVEEERFNRVPHAKEAMVDNTYLMPFASIDYCLAEAGIDFSDIDLIGFSYNMQTRRLHRPYLMQWGPVLPGGYKTTEGEQRFEAFVMMVPELLGARYGLPANFVWNRFRYLEHHLCHLASAYYASPYDRAAVLAIDGIGEGATVSFAHATGNNLQIIHQIDYPHSLGFVWELITAFLGFKGNYDECKIMGLAAYGDPERFAQHMNEMLRTTAKGFEVKEIKSQDRKLLFSGDYSPLERFFGIKRRLPYEPLSYKEPQTQHADLAAALQHKTEEVILHLAQIVHEKTGEKRLCMAGGVALNCVANARVAEEGPFENLWVQPAAGDAGTSIGAALLLQCHPDPMLGLGRSRVEMCIPYLGPESSEADIAATLSRYRLVSHRVDNPAETAARLVADGKIVGWFQGRMEFGPRALGNRCLLAHPGSMEIRDRLNQRVKHRHDFRPFCPTILADAIPDWVGSRRSLCDAAQYMLAAYPIRSDKQELIPAVVHADGTCRLQALGRDQNPLFHELISHFEGLTGLPMILNTSFNDREPIVCTPEDAAECFLKTEFDAMILGNYLVEGPKPWVRESQEADNDLKQYSLISRRLRGNL